jgi:hypothetical protein
MPPGSRVSSILTHLLAVLLGVGVPAAWAMRESAERSLGSPAKRLGFSLLALETKPSPEAVSRSSKALAEAGGALGEPARSVLELRILAIAARASGKDADIVRAAEACRAQKWNQCDRASILEMGGEL